MKVFLVARLVSQYNAFIGMFSFSLKHFIVRIARQETDKIGGTNDLMRLV